ncbi:MAG: TIGR03749 family integrating conjugative element protein [Gammaproteobacteria bacterium]|nr:TIGR03749 family integrating conjugative element protein [Gammaproteobacteria bacterium]
MSDHFFRLLKCTALLAGLCSLFPAAVAQQDALVQHDTHARPSVHAPQNVSEPVVWRKAPIRILLATGEERLVHFPGSVRVALPPSLASALRVQSIHGTLYLHADAPFSTTRVLVYTQPEGPIYVLDLEAVTGGVHALPDIEIVARTPQAFISGTKDGGRDTSPWGYVALTRFAAQTLYAPSRLVPHAPGIVSVPVAPNPVTLVRDCNVRAVPVAAWRADGFYVSAVRLHNLESRPVTLDPRSLAGHWLAATFQRNRLQPTRDALDTTTVYLVSDRPLDAAL